MKNSLNRNTSRSFHADTPVTVTVMKVLRPIDKNEIKEALISVYETCIHQKSELYPLPNKNILPTSISLYYGHLNSYMLDRLSSYATCHILSLKNQSSTVLI